ncbi:MAG: hypothetical protein ACQEUT_18040 [Bacillota bacterium]
MIRVATEEELLRKELEETRCELDRYKRRYKELTEENRQLYPYKATIQTIIKELKK